MGKAKPDFKKDLNLLLGIYYQHGGVVVIYKELHKQGISIRPNDIWTIAKALEQDGYIELIHGHSTMPIGKITGKGRLFQEAGGYRDMRSPTERVTEWFKNHWMLAWVGFVIAGLGAVISYLKDIKELIEWLQPK